MHTPSSSWPPSMQCLSFSGPLYVPWVPICIYQVYCRTKDKRFFFFISWLPSTRQNEFNYRDVFKYRKATTKRYKCIFLLKGRLNKVKDNLLTLYHYLHSNFIQSLSYVEDFNSYTVSTKKKDSINYKKYKLQYRQELK